MTNQAIEDFVEQNFRRILTLPELPEGAKVGGRITSLKTDSATLKADSITLRGGKLEAAIELVEIEGEEHPSAYITFGGTYSNLIPLPREGYLRQYKEIVRALKKGDYMLAVNHKGQLDISIGCRKLSRT